MELNRLIAKRIDLLKFGKPPVQPKRRKEPQNFIVDYILLGAIVSSVIILILFFVAAVFLL